MKNIFVASLLIVASISHAQAQAPDIIGGPGGDSAQTMHHCGFLPAKGDNYASSPLTIRIIQKKLSAAGYNTGPIDGRFGPTTRNAVRAFQTDYQLSPTGIVNGETASHLAYSAHPSANVQRCYRPASNFFR